MKQALSHWRRRLAQREGQSLVEFALVVSLLAVLLFAIIQYGFIFAAHISLRNASNVGARYGTLSSPRPTTNQIRNVTLGAIGPLLQTNYVVQPITVETTATVGTLTGATRVQIQYNLPLILPFVVPGKNAGGSLTLSGTTVAW